MSRLNRPAAVFAAAVLAAPLVLLPIRAQADGAKERVVTVFTGGLGQVWERRGLAKGAGPREILLGGISDRAIPESLRLAGTGGDFAVREQTLNTNLISPRNLLERHLGKEIGYIKVHPTTGEKTIVPATVVSLAGGVVLRMNGKLVTGLPQRLAFPDDTAGMVTTPTVTATVDAGPANDGLTLTYLTEGLNWSTDYTATLATDGSAINLEGWATIANGTRVGLDADRLRLVAGQVNRVQPPRPLPKAMRMMASAPEAAQDAAGAALPMREAVGAVHVYTLPGAVALPPGGRKQVALLGSVKVPVTETLISMGHPPVFGPQRGETEPVHPDLRLSFKNTSLVPGGLPLPAGVLRVYREGALGGTLFAGADHIADTPDGGTVEASLGQAFDVTVKREQTAFNRLDAKGRTVEAAFKVEAKNGRDTPATLRLDEVLPGDWTVTAKSQAFERIGGAARFMVTVPAKGSAVVTYSVRVLR